VGGKERLMIIQWQTKQGAIAATYSTPSSTPFTYNVPEFGM
jgi:hypothetical protein